MDGDEPKWGLSRTTRLSWSRHPGSESLVFHSGSGQTVSLDELGEAVLRSLEQQSQTQFELHQGLHKEGLLAQNSDEARRLFLVLKLLYDSALIDRQWPDAFSG